jgi:hypothetical protein
MLTPPATPGAQWQLATLHRFIGYIPGSRDGAFPNADLSAGPRGDLFGTTQAGGGETAAYPGGAGTIFELSPPKTPGGVWAYKIIHSFSYSDDPYPMAGLTLDRDGVLYGTALGGTVFALTPPHFRGTPSLLPNPNSHWQIRYLVTLGIGRCRTVSCFLRRLAEDWPEGKLVFDNYSNIFGTTLGLRKSCGSVFEVMPPANTGRPQWISKAIYIFPFPTRYPSRGYVCNPVGRLIRSNSGTFFGMTHFGGLFEILSGSGFTIGTASVFDNTGPGLLLDVTTGVLYGGSAPWFEDPQSPPPPRLFALVPTGDPTVWTQTTLWTFQGNNPGLTGTLIFDLSGNLVGTLSDGTVFGFSLP